MGCNASDDILSHLTLSEKQVVPRLISGTPILKFSLCDGIHPSSWGQIRSYVWKVEKLTEKVTALRRTEQLYKREVTKLIKQVIVK